jgi:hypothetical protein
MDRKMETLREQIAEEQLNVRMKNQIMVKDGLMTAEEAAAANPMNTMMSPRPGGKGGMAAADGAPVGRCTLNQVDP